MRPKVKKSEKKEDGRFVDSQSTNPCIYGIWKWWTAEYVGRHDIDINREVGDDGQAKFRCAFAFNRCC